MCALKLKFDPNQQYQLDAISCVVDLFDGLSYRAPSFDLSGAVIPNIPDVDAINWEPIYDNFREIQTRNGIPNDTLISEIEMDDGLILDGVGLESHSYPHFTIEMETGTGKTYVYLRTMFELRKKYGFSKFIIIVPSIAIYEGVFASYDDNMRAHFRTLYGNDLIHLSKYDGDQVNIVKSFATSPITEAMIMTIDSFNKATNVIYKATDKIMGELKPHEYIQKVRPILIVDEPQSSISSEKALSACRTLKPLFGLRYSATHRESPNEIYKLTPFDAFRQNLVKKIEVIGVTEINDFGKPFLALEKVGRDSKGIYAKLKANVYENNHIKEAEITLRNDGDLFDATNREEYRGKGYKVSEISLRPGNQFIEFVNALKLACGKSIGPVKEEIFSKQIEETVIKHMRRQEELWSKGIKVLSLFFIDKVDNYVSKDGIIKVLFDKMFDKYKKSFPHFKGHSPEDVREAYFAKRVDRAGIAVAIDTNSSSKAERELEREAFELIMKKKAQLLSFSEPVSFIFAHSALKEGWDNPNVFQICTLNQSGSEIKKRQEIGRGLRLSVNQEGSRIFDESINILTIIANESYENFASTLQSEYQEDGDAPPPRVTNARREAAKRNDAIFKSKGFMDFCKHLFKEASYTIQLDTDSLVDTCIKKINSTPIDAHRILVQRGKYTMIDYLIELLEIRGTRAKLRITRKDTDGGSANCENMCVKGTNLSGLLGNDPILKEFTILDIIEEDGDYQVLFSKERLSKDSPIHFQIQGKLQTDRETVSASTTLPIFDLIGRVSAATNLTRPTVNRIFKGLKEEVKKKLFLNPEGFATVFGDTITAVLADHVADNIEYTIIKDDNSVSLDEMFPVRKTYPQKEVIPGGDKSLYDLIQWDSDKEKRFVQVILEGDKENIVFFLKFPPNFKVPIPKIINNYNPDWGLLREYEKKKTVELVRETKGNTDPSKLQFANEGRKIACAKKYFKKLGVDYKVINPDDANATDYWLLADGSMDGQIFETRFRPDDKEIPLAAETKADATIDEVKK